MTAPAPLSPRPVPAHQRRDIVPVAASSCLDRPMIPDAHVLLAMAAACRRAADPALVLVDDVKACVEACPDAGPGFLRAAADLSTYAARLDQAAHCLFELAQDPDLAGWLAHRAAGGVVLLKQADGAGRVVVADEERPAAQPVGLKRVLMKLGQRFRKVA